MGNVVDVRDYADNDTIDVKDVERLEFDAPSGHGDWTVEEVIAELRGSGNACRQFLLSASPGLYPVVEWALSIEMNNEPRGGHVKMMQRWLKCAHDEWRRLEGVPE